jgi:hypothetical protein
MSTSARDAITKPHPTREQLQCTETYRKLFAKPTVNIRIVFGYKDARPARFVGDRHERLAFVQRILRTCEGANQACGFNRDDDNADLFTKEIDGPDGRKVNVRLVVASSSIGSDDASNRQDAYQKWQSGYAERIFLTGIEKADIVFYNGHSRFGGGPDFEVPHLTEAGTVDVSYYRGRRPGFQKIREKLHERVAKGEDSLKLFGLFSCTSSQHFAEEIEAESKGTGLISSRSLIYYTDALDNSLSALSAVLEMRCPREFRAAIRQGQPVNGAVLQGFF